MENTKSHKLLRAVKNRRGWKHWPWLATLERPGISLNKNSQVTQASNLIIGVSTKTEYLMLFVYLDNQRTGDKLVPTNTRVEGLRRAHRDPVCAVWTRWCLQQPHFHAAHKRRCFFFFSPPSFSFLLLSLLITESNGSSELWGIFTAELHGGETWFSLCSPGYQF